MRFLEKLQNLSLKTRKIILWSILAIIGLAFLFFWVDSIQRKIKSFRKEEFINGMDLSSLREELGKAPKIEMPEFNEEEIKELEKQLKENEK